MLNKISVVNGQAHHTVHTVTTVRWNICLAYGKRCANVLGFVQNSEKKRGKKL